MTDVDVSAAYWRRQALAASGAVYVGGGAVDRDDHEDPYRWDDVEVISSGTVCRALFWKMWPMVSLVLWPLL